MLSRNILFKRTIFKRLITYDKLFTNTVKNPQHYNISLDSLRKENRALLLANRNNPEKTEEVNKIYNDLQNDMSRYILYLNTLSPSDLGEIDIKNLDADPRLNKINDFEFLEEVMDTMEQIDTLKNIDELDTIKSNVSEECAILKQGIEDDFQNSNFDESLEKFQKLKYLNGIIRHVDSRVDTLEDVE